MNKRHYVYRITNTKLNKHYYGVRTSKLEPSKDLGIRYFSRSFDTQFIEDQKNNPQHYKYTIVSEFDSREEALELEIKLHARFDVAINESFYNRTKQTSIGFDNTGIIFSEEVRTKLRDSAAKIKHTKKYREDKSKASKGKLHYHDPITNEHRMFHSHDVLPGFVKGRINTLVHHKQIKCPHCNKTGGINTMPRWHFDNCKMKQNT